MRCHTRFIVNPRSGRATDALAAVRAFAARTGAEVLLTEHRRHAHALALAAREDGCERVVAVGGDGTMNEVAAALVGSAVILGLVPCGSGDGLGRQLGLHGAVTHALRVLETGRPRVIDSGVADGHPFFTVAGLGFEALIAQRFNELVRRGFLRYLTTSTRAWWGEREHRYRITAGGNAIECSAFTLAIANACQYGNNALIAPRGRLDDGRIDLCAVPRPSLFSGLPLAIRLFTGSIDRGHRVTSLQAERFVIERESPGPIHTDGETHAAGTTLEFSVRPASLRVLVPISTQRDECVASPC